MIKTGITYSANKLRELAAFIGLKTASKLRSDFALLGNELSKVEINETIKADLKSENYILEQLKLAGFKGKIVTEESGVIETGDSELIAIIDPLDGSINYSLGIPWFSVSIAFAHRIRDEATFKDVIAGAVVPVINPIPISFAKNKGVYIGETLITELTNHPFNDLLVVAFYGDDPEALTTYNRIHKKLVEKHGKIKIRSLGSVALDLVYLALRRIDIFIDARAKLRNVDVTAALGILNELNGSFKNISGEVFDFSVEEIAPINSLLASWSTSYLDELIEMME